jgi:dTDP-L-rhamnose 4-epimerase
MKGLPLIVYEDGNQTRDFVHIDDVVEANIVALENSAADFQAFNVGSGKTTSVLEYARAVMEKLGSTSGVRLPGEYRRGDNRHSVSSVDKLNRLGWSPRKNLSAIFDDFLAWIESIGGIPSEIPDAYSDMRAAGVILAAAE